MRTRPIFPRGLPGSTTCLKNSTNFGGKKIKHNTVLWFSLQFFSYETFLILRITERDTNNAYGSLCKVPVILVRFWLNLNVLDICLKNTQISNLMKIRPVGADLLHADGRTDMTKLNVSFRNIANAPKTKLLGLRHGSSTKRKPSTYTGQTHGKTRNECSRGV
jgi:hypothetical protein